MIVICDDTDWSKHMNSLMMMLVVSVRYYKYAKWVDTSDLGLLLTKLSK